MPSEARGLYRTQTPQHRARYAWVSYGDGGGEDLPEETYRARGLEPNFDALPTKDEYYFTDDPILDNPGANRA
jgi:hypothetical protein